MSDKREFHSVVPKNKDLVLSVFKDSLPASGTVLEIGSGTGEHIAHFAPHFPTLVFQPSDRIAERFDSIKAWSEHAAAGRINPPILLDLMEEEGTLPSADFIYSINVIHIAPWKATENLIKRAGSSLSTGGILFFYGPFFQDGVETAPSNVSFDEFLRDNNPQSGIRSLDTITDMALGNGFSKPDIINMPANNLCVAFKHI